MADKFDNAIRAIKKSIKLNDGIVSEAVENFSYIIEPLLQTNGDTLKKIMETDDDIMTSFQQFLLIGFWGILYYIAKTLSSSDFKEMLRDTDTLYINLAGNGSMLYTWVRDYAYELSGSYSKIDNAFGEMLNQFLELDDSSKIKVIIDFKEDDLKTEAARGLLMIDEKIDINELMDNNRLINGVKCTIKMKNGNKEPLEEYTSIIDKQHKSISEFFTDPKNSAIDEIIPDNIMEDITNFINSLKGIFGDEKSFYTLISEDEKDALRTNFGVALKKNIESGTIAPAFILELESFLRAKLGY